MARRTVEVLAFVVAALAVTACGGDPGPPVFPEIVAYSPANDRGDKIVVSFRVPVEEIGPYKAFRVERSPDGEEFALVERHEVKHEKIAREQEKEKEEDRPKFVPYTTKDEGDTLDTKAPVRGEEYYYRVVGVRTEGEPTVTAVAGPVAPVAEWFDGSKLAVLFAVLVFSALVFWFIEMAKRNPDVYVRPIAGLSAMSEAIGRATEMGRPVLYVPGIADLDDIQTITALVILKQVARETAEYETPLIVPCRMPVVMTAAEEAVRTGTMEAGKPDLFNPDNIRFLSDEQFAFTAATNGIMLREKTAANIYLGAFWAESLILAETGFLAGAIQIAGTANVSQLPFFVAACDYTLIGEEIYAASAYLSREPVLMGSLKGSDWAKVIFAVLILVGVVLATKTGEDGTAISKAFADFFQ